MASPAQCGPWPRPVGETFLFAGQELHPDGWTSLYAERGGRSLTFGLSLGGRLAGTAGVDASRGETARLRLFLRRPIRWRPGKTQSTDATRWLFAGQIAAELDLNADGSTTPRLTLGLSSGRSFKVGGRDGWAALDIWVSGSPRTDTRTNVETVVGLRATPRLTVELGLFGEFGESTSITLAPIVQLDMPRAGALRAGLVVKEDYSAMSMGWMRNF